jgi:MerR family copper efflux transcriptional regulator
MANLLIGELSRRTGVSSPTIRYYEQIGLLTRPHRSTSGYRRYSEATIDELRFIRKAQTLGFSLDEIRQILTLSRSGSAPCDRVLSLAREHLAALDERIRQLQEFRARLANAVSRWSAERDPLTCGRLCRFIADAHT